MATRTAKKPAAKKATQAKAGAGPAMAEHSKDAKSAKPTFGKAAPKKVSPAAKPAAAKAKAPASAKSGKSVAARVVRKVKDTASGAASAVAGAASGAVSLAASVIPGKSKKGAKAKS